MNFGETNSNIFRFEFLREKLKKPFIFELWRENLNIQTFEFWRENFEKEAKKIFVL